MRFASDSPEEGADAQRPRPTMWCAGRPTGSFDDRSGANVAKLNLSRMVLRREGERGAGGRRRIGEGACACSANS